jgi:hypothetical protein
MLPAFLTLPLLLSRRFPLIGPYAAGLVGVATSLASVGATLAGSALVIAAAWARFRPVHAATLATAAAGAIFGQAWMLRQRALSKTLGAPKHVSKRRLV